MKNTILQLSSSRIFSDKAFLCDVLCFFAGAQSGQVDMHCYSEPKHKDDLVCGGGLWERFVNAHEAYYLFCDDPVLIQQNTPLLAELCGNARLFVDLGPGSLEAFEKKTLPILQAVVPVRYEALDLNEHFLRDVVSCLHKRYPFTKACYRVANFFEEMLPLEENSLIFLSGSTISNIKADLRFETATINLTKALAHFGDALIEGGYFVFTYDSNQDEDSIRRSYDHPAMAAHNTNFIQLVRRELPTEGLCEEDFMHVTEWVPENHLLKQLLVLKRDVSFGVAGHRFDLEAGTKLHVTNCFKFTDDLIRDAARAAGFTKTHICTLENSPMRMAILEKK
ncbi:MAG: L-histidine N(alpha)-methyltransferase [Bdellovibrionales bacterium]